jgi:hypothetical protein
MASITALRHRGFELRFQSIHDAGRGFAFACDAAGHVDIDAMGERERNRYFYARTCVGREFLMPTVRTCAA